MAGGVVNREGALARAGRHFELAESLLSEVEAAIRLGDRAEIVRLQGGEAVARAAAHAALGQGLVALAGAEPAPLAPLHFDDMEPAGGLCGHNRGVIRRYATEGAMGSSWLHATDMSRCDSPPTG
jgi:hypothetical protein